MTWAEAGLVAASFLLLGAYHVFFFRETRTHPRRTMVGTANEERAIWVAKMVERGDAILAIQTLRNWTMSATYLASTAMLIGAGLLGFLVSVDRISMLVHALNLLGDEGDTLLTFKIVLLIANFFVAFFNFSLALRFYNYVALGIGAIADRPGGQAEITDHLNRAAAHYTLGMRGYYLGIPIVLWLFGPLWLLAGAVATTVALYRHDHPGRHPGAAS